VRALVFDFDGLILDTETPEFTVWNQIFAEHGVEMPSDYWIQVIGRGAEQQIERPPELLTRLTGSYVETESARLERRGRILELIQREQARPGVVSLLDQAREAGVPAAIASSSRHEWVDGFVDRLGLLDRFQAILCADDVQRAKPFPDLYLLACERLQAEPTHSIALEDSPNGIAAAKSAGLFTIAVPNSVTANLDLSAADLRIDDLSTVQIELLASRSLGRWNRGDR
jgi:HAD superfamily hydrolase (TIGR01509 family)